MEPAGRGRGSRRRWQAPPALTRCIVASGLGVLVAAAPVDVRAEAPIGVPCEAAGAGVAEIEVIGASFVADGDRSSRAPIYSVVLGDPRPAEARAFVWSERFGMYGLDGTLWTRERQARWRQTVLRRPRGSGEIAAFADAPEAFKREIAGNADLLPPALRHLEDVELLAIEYVVCFGSEGVRVALKAGVTAAEATSLLGSIRQALNGHAERSPTR